MILRHADGWKWVRTQLHICCCIITSSVEDLNSLSFMARDRSAAKLSQQACTCTKGMKQKREKKRGNTKFSLQFSGIWWKQAYFRGIHCLHSNTLVIPVILIFDVAYYSMECKVLQCSTQHTGVWAWNTMKMVGLLFIYCCVKCSVPYKLLFRSQW